jgi:plastocyanin
MRASARTRPERTVTFQPVQRQSTARPALAQLALAMIGALAASLALATAGTAANEAAVQIVGRAYQPAELTVLAGQTVTWHNSSLMQHTVTALNGAFNSGALAGGTSFSYTFATPGTFNYKCTIHPTMKGTVVVLAPGAAPPPQSVRLTLSKRRGPHGGLTIVHVQANAPGAAALLQSRSSSRSPWKTRRHALLSARGMVTFTLIGARGSLRAVVRPVGGGAQSISKVVVVRA